MGQMANGILYGSEARDLPDDEDGEAWPDIVMCWEKSEGIAYLSTDIPRIRVESEGGKELVGVWVAVGGGGEDGAPYFLENCVPLDRAADLFPERIETAKKLWQQFAAWVAKNESLVLPPPTLWLTPCETA